MIGCCEARGVLVYLWRAPIKCILAGCESRTGYNSIGDERHAQAPIGESAGSETVLTQGIYI